MENLNYQKIIFGLKVAIVTVLTVIALSFVIGCEKESIDIQPITVEVLTEGLIQSQMTKNFNPDTWVYSYNPNQFVLTFTGTHTTYTYLKSIAELQSGFNITVLPDSYEVTYQSVTTGSGVNAPLTNQLDIVIDETESIMNGSPVTLEANHDDYLVVIDFPVTSPPVILNPVGQNWNSYFFGMPDNSFYYAYYNIEGDLQIRYTFYNTVTNQNQTLTKTIPNASKNNIYHIVQQANGVVSIDILPFDYNMIGW